LENLTKQAKEKNLICLPVLIVKKIQSPAYHLVKLNSYK
jgi:hypothetical protein